LEQAVAAFNDTLQVRTRVAELATLRKGGGVDPAVVYFAGQLPDARALAKRLAKRRRI
jgi:hypothetical protein